MNGLIVINKPQGYTSRDVVNILSKKFGTKKIGHTGTLDPIADGVLVCVIGKCTKLCDILACDEKEYIATMEFGILTDTLDKTGKVLKESDKIISLKDVKKAFNYFIGDYMQEVPLYSAIKVNGKKLYDYARNNESVELPKRMVSIKKLEIIKFNNNILTFKVLVSKGTYIRSLIRDIGIYLGSYGNMLSLTRIKQGDFSITDAFTLDDINKDIYKIISVEEIFKDYPKVEIDNDMMLNQINNGLEMENKFNSLYVLYTYNNEIISVYQINKKNQKKIKPLIMV